MNKEIKKSDYSDDELLRSELNNGYSVVKIVDCGNVIETKQMSHKTPKGHSAIKKIDANRYVDKSSGEIKYYNKGFVRIDNMQSLYRTFEKLRNLINTNFRGNQNELFITLTYAENKQINQDFKETAEDFKNFMKRLKYEYKDKSFEYIKVIEPQASGRIHYHVLLKDTSNTKLFIENDKLSNLWGKGFTTIKRIQNVDNIGAYLTSYLTAIPLDELSENEQRKIDDSKIEEKEVQNIKTNKDDETYEINKIETKKMVKGGRLKYYPRDINYYTKSKNILEPKINYHSKKWVDANLNDDDVVYSKITELEKAEYRNIIETKQYNKKRNK